MREFIVTYEVGAYCGQWSVMALNADDAWVQFFYNSNEYLRLSERDKDRLHLESILPA